MQQKDRIGKWARSKCQCWSFVIAFWLVLIPLGTIEINAQTTNATKGDEVKWRQLSIKLVDQKYDANQLRKELGMVAEDQPCWVPMQPGSILFLTALDLAGEIKLQVDEKEIRLEMPVESLSQFAQNLAPCELTIPANLGSSKKIIVFVHGLEGGAATFSAAQKRCASHGIVAGSFDYPNDGPTRNAADSLRDQLNDFATEHPKSKIVIVAHSLGGLVATWAVTDPEFPPGLVTDVVTLGTPFLGSSIAEFQAESELLNVGLRVLGKDFKALDTVSDGRGEAAIDIEPGSDFLQQLAIRKLPDWVKFHLGAGTKSYLSDEDQTLLIRELPVALSRRGIGAQYVQKLTRLVSAPESIDGSADGAVTIASATGLKGHHSKRTFPRTHNGLLGLSTPRDGDKVFDWILEELGWRE